MTELVLDLPAAPDPEVKDLVERLLYWVTPDVHEVRVVDSTRLLVDYAGAGDPAEVGAALLAAAVEVMAGAVFPAVVRYETRAALRAPAPADPFPELVRRGWVSQEAAGSYTYTGVVAELFERLDRLFTAKFAALRPHPVRLPALLAADTALRTGGLTASPHTVNFVFHLVEGRSVPSRFAAECVDAERGAVDLGDLGSTARTPDAVLSTAACQPYFRALRDRVLDGPAVVTGRASCYRYESGAVDGLRRSREFSVRELVCVAAPEEVARVREHMLGLAEGLLADLGLSARIATASDPFFIDTASRMRMYQLSFEVKHELLARLPFDGSELAVGSVNHHDDHFGRAWRIRTADGGWAHSCCLGLGLDRWCYAVLAQFGLDPDAWPEALRIGGGVGAY